MIKTALSVKNLSKVHLLDKKKTSNVNALNNISLDVKQGEILLLIEAMKTFNEIKAPKSGIIKKIEILNSQPVEFGDTLVIFE